MGAADRVVRVVVALVIVLLYFVGVIGGTVATVLGVVVVALLVTSASARCPGYLPLGISTCRPSAPDSSA